MPGEGWGFQPVGPGPEAVGTRPQSLGGPVCLGQPGAFVRFFHGQRADLPRQDPPPKASLAGVAHDFGTKPLSGLSNKFLHLSIVSLEFNSCIVLGEFPVNRFALLMASGGPCQDLSAPQLTLWEPAV